MIKKGNPLSLSTLFFTEMWERFSYYGMRALLVLYLVNSLNYSESDALHIYAVYTGLVYLTPLIGGYLADRFLGAQKSIFIGGLTMMIGHFLMAFPDYLYLAIGMLIIGNGYFKPNISSLLGRLYKSNDLRRDSGFSIFYVGINLGAFLAPLIVGYVGETINWHYGFAIAGLLTGAIMTLVGFVPDTVNTEASITGIRLFYSGLPIVGTLGAMWIMRKYNLTEERALEISAELVKRKVKSYIPPLTVNGLSFVSKTTLLGKNVSFNGIHISGCGKVVIGDNFHSGKECLIISQNHNFNSGKMIPYDNTYICKDITIKDNVWLGDRVIILGGVSIGEGAIIQAGSVVVSDIPK